MNNEIIISNRRYTKVGNILWKSNIFFTLSWLLHLSGMIRGAMMFGFGHYEELFGIFLIFPLFYFWMILHTDKRFSYIITAKLKGKKITNSGRNTNK